MQNQSLVPADNTTTTSNSNNNHHPTNKGPKTRMYVPPPYHHMVRRVRTLQRVEEECVALQKTRQREQRALERDRYILFHFGQVASIFVRHIHDG